MSITNGSATALAIRHEPSTTPVITAALLTTYPLARREVGQNIANVDRAGIWPPSGKSPIPHWFHPRRARPTRLLPLYQSARSAALCGWPRSCPTKGCRWLRTSAMTDSLNVQPSICRRGTIWRRRDCGHLHHRAGDAESRHNRRADERRGLRGAKRGGCGGVCRLHVNALHQHHQYAHEMLDPRASRRESSREVGHHLPGLQGHVRAADEVAVLIDGVLAADVHRRGARRDDSHVAEGRAREESLGTQ